MEFDVEFSCEPTVFPTDLIVGEDGVGISSIEQIPSEEDGGENILIIKLTNGKEYRFTVRNGSKGSPEAGTGSGGESIFIGYTHFTNQYGIPESGELDVASYITYKPGFNEAYDGCGMPLAIKDGFVDSSGYYQGYTFHSFRFEWNYQSAGFSIYFHTFLDNGERKVIRLGYQYADSEATSPQSITAYLTTDNPIGDIETALDNIIAIQESLVGGDSV